MSTSPVEKKYGEWESPLDSGTVCGSSVSLVRMYTDPYDEENIYWTELRPEEGGRTILFSKNVSADHTTKAERWTTDPVFDVYDMVHEYGGSPYFVNNKIAYCSNLVDCNIYSQTKEDKTPMRVTSKKEWCKFRYADGEFSKADNFFFCIREDHTDASMEANNNLPINVIVAINARTGDEKVFASGNDFYSSPQVSPDGKKLAWITWNFTNMPWDETELWVGDFVINGDEISIGKQSKIAGQSGVNFMEPRWTSDGELLVISDKENWWNLYHVQDLKTGELRCLHQDKKHELGGPCWQFGNRSYSPNPTNSNQIAVLYGGKPAFLDMEGNYNPLDILKEDQYASHCLFSANGGYLFLQVVSPTEPAKIICVDVKSSPLSSKDFHHSAEIVVEEGDLSLPEEITFDIHGKEGSDIKQAYGYFYPPKNANFVGLKGTKPPVLLKIHGGPTSSARRALDLQKQYFTSRGIAIFDVNYRGSTGYGTPFRNELKKHWGSFDIQDALDGALHLAKIGKVDRDSLLISGGSSGGYTTLACLTFDQYKYFPDKARVFAAGASYYGISDLAVLAAETHKFEARYCDEMIALYPKEIQTYHDRSPGYEENSPYFGAPCCFFQGLLDKVVPPNQSKKMFDIINAKNLPCAYVEFPDEAHGFKKKENKMKALDGEFYFYSQILGFKAFDQGIEIPINNLHEKSKKHQNK